MRVAPYEVVIPGAGSPAVLVLLLLGPLQAVNAQPVRTLTLEDVLTLAEQNNPRLKSAQAGAESAAAMIETAKARPNPTLTFGVLGRQRAIVDGAIPGMLHGMVLNQPVELPKIRNARIRAASVGSETSAHAMAEARLFIRGAVKQAFFEVLRRNAELTIARDNLQLLDDLRRRIEVQVRVGEAAKLEYTRAEAEVAAARIQVHSVELKRAAALSALDAAIGSRLGGVQLSGSLASRAVLPALDELRSEVLKTHPSIAVAESETRRASLEVEHQKALRTPQPSVWVDILRQPDSSQYRWGMTVDLPVWNKRAGPIAEAVAAQSQARALADQRRLEITALLERAYSLYEVASQQVSMFETGTVRVAEAAVQAAEAAFRFGERSIVEVLDAQRVLRAARQDYISAQFDKQQALIELEQLGVVVTNGGRP